MHLSLIYSQATVRSSTRDRAVLPSKGEGYKVVKKSTYQNSSRGNKDMSLTVSHASVGCHLFGVQEDIASQV